MTVEAQGMWICWFGALKFNQNWIKHKKRRKNMPVFAVFEHFWRFFNFGRILAHQTTKFTFLDVYCFFWHPTHLWMWLSSAWKKIGHIWHSELLTSQNWLVLYLLRNPVSWWIPQIIAVFQSWKGGSGCGPVALWGCGPVIANSGICHHRSGTQRSGLR